MSVATVKKGPQPILNLCPYGCEQKELNEHGYCHHLLGWTNKGKLVELRDLLPEGERSAGREITGRKRIPIPKGAVLVECGCSSRVYHKDGNDKLKVPDKRDPEDIELIEETEAA